MVAMVAVAERVMEEEVAPNMVAMVAVAERVMEEAVAAVAEAMAVALVVRAAADVERTQEETAATEETRVVTTSGCREGGQTRGSSRYLSGHAARPSTRQSQNQSSLPRRFRR